MHTVRVFCIIKCLSVSNRWFFLLRANAQSWDSILNTYSIYSSQYIVNTENKNRLLKKNKKKLLCNVKNSIEKSNHLPDARAWFTLPDTILTMTSLGSLASIINNLFINTDKNNTQLEKCVRRKPNCYLNYITQQSADNR